ncbi:hypothetical protein AGLY_012535 [Aphis glycines]|uniref:Uncharacterized protein n=1 Tax=Aphis glycines TaxID=307491 RepID=A0A6G0T8Y9_APHGL|nr:hypothetical protein AGLY_012535 [Aphis glycines]
MEQPPKNSKVKSKKFPAIFKKKSGKTTKKCQKTGIFMQNQFSIKLIFYIVISIKTSRHPYISFNINDEYSRKFRRTSETKSILGTIDKAVTEKKFREKFNILDSERSEECIDFTMIITSRNNAPISNYGGGFRCKINIFQQFSKKSRKTKKIDGKTGIFTQIQFSTASIFLYGCNSKTNHCKYLKFLPNVYFKFLRKRENLQILENFTMSIKFFGPIKILENFIQSSSYVILIVIKKL